MSITDKLKKASELGAPISINEHEQYRVLMRDGVEVIIDPENLDASTEWLIIGALIDRFSINKRSLYTELSYEQDGGCAVEMSVYTSDPHYIYGYAQRKSLLEAALDSYINCWGEAS